MPAGITSQYGFLYQRYIFIKTVLDNVGMDRFFVYEGKDDIDISETDRIMSVCVSNDTFVQVKKWYSFKKLLGKSAWELAPY